MDENKWTMALRVVAGSGDDAYTTWASDAAYSEGETERQTTDESVPGMFKSPIVDSNWEKVKKV